MMTSFWNWNVSNTVSDWMKNNYKTLNPIVEQSWNPQSFGNFFFFLPEMHKQPGWVFMTEELRDMWTKWHHDMHIQHYRCTS